jgi:tetratricopeptide (TPR) repeat protein
MRRALGLLVALACLLAGAQLHADKRDKRAEARVHYDNGLRKFDLGKYDEAAEEFVQAYELVGEPPNILYNIAQAYRLAEKYERSAQFYRSFLRKVPDVPNRAEIEGRIAEMDERAADQKRQAERRAAEQRDAERKAEQRRLDAQRKPAGGEEAKPEPKGPEPAPREVVEDDRPRPGRSLKIVGYALCGLTGAALGLGIAMTVLAVKASHTVEAAAARGDVFDASLHDTESKGQVFDKVQIVGYSLAGAAAIGAGLAIYFGFRAEQHAQQEEAPPSQAARRRRLAWPLLAPAVDARGGGLVLQGRF